jgi:folate-binding protein YgfZ
MAGGSGLTQGYRALREGAARIDLSARGRILAHGEDRSRLLHAMTTNHVQQLVPGQGCYAFFLSAQGRILADVMLLCREDHLVLDLEPEVKDRILQHLDKFIIADDVTLEDVTEKTSEIAFEGPQAAALLESAGIPLPAEPIASLDWNGRLIVKASSTGAPGYRIIGSTEGLPEAAAATAEDVLAVRLEHGFPRYGDDITEAHLVQETGRLDAVHFSKGCYIGQEIVERVRSRGQVKWRLVPLRIAAAASPARGAKLMAGDKEAGEITSASFSPAEEQVRALGYIRAEFLRPGAVLTLDGSDVQVLEPIQNL